MLEQETCTHMCIKDGQASNPSRLQASSSLPVCHQGPGFGMQCFERGKLIPNELIRISYIS